MSTDKVVSGTEYSLRKGVYNAIVDGKYEVAVKLYERFVSTGSTIGNPATHGVLAILWRETGNERLLVATVKAVREWPGVDPNLVANVLRDLMLFRAMQGRRDEAAALMREIRNLRTDRVQEVVDTTADAKRLMYAMAFVQAYVVICRASVLVAATPLDPYDKRELQIVRDHANWSCMIAALAGNVDAVRGASTWILEGRKVFRKDEHGDVTVKYPREVKANRIQLASWMRKLCDLPRLLVRPSCYILARAALWRDMRH